METENTPALLKPINQQTDAQLFATPRAVQQLLALQQNEAENSRFRIGVFSGGCAGFQYSFSFDQAQNEDDIIFSTDGIECIVDEMSMSFLNGVILDYEEDMMGASFQLKNPNASSACGCGSSFSI
jgi:iron-sulfur cluster insertion protein